MDGIDLAFLVLISFGAGVILAFFIMDVGNTTIQNNVLNEVCNELTDGEYPLFNDNDDLSVDIFNCIKEDNDEKIKIG